LRRTASYEELIIKIDPSATVDSRKNKEKKCSKHLKVLGVYFGYVGGKIPWADGAQIFLEENNCDVIMYFQFGDDRFRGLASGDGQILPFPIDFHGCPYNTLTLPCESVIYLSQLPPH